MIFNIPYFLNLIPLKMIPMRNHTHIWILLILLIPGEHFSGRIIQESIEPPVQLCHIDNLLLQE